MWIAFLLQFFSPSWPLRSWELIKVVGWWISWRTYVDIGRSFYLKTLTILSLTEFTAVPFIVHWTLAHSLSSWAICHRIGSSLPVAGWHRHIWWGVTWYWPEPDKWKRFSWCFIGCLGSVWETFWLISSPSFPCTSLLSVPWS